MSETEFLTDRAIIRITGEDRQVFLQGLITQDIEKVAKERSAFAALLTPQGKILFDFIVAADADSYLLDCRTETSQALVKRLSLYKLRAKVAIALDETLGVCAGVGTTPQGTIACYADPRREALGWRAICSLPTSGEETSDGSNKYHTRRIMAGVPEMGADYGSDEMFLTDVNYDLLMGVDYKKGCFIGQEVTSRMKRKGDIRKRTLLASFEGTVPASGKPIKAGASTLGDFMSASGNNGLAFIRLDRWEKANASGEPITCDDVSVTLSAPDYLEME